MTRINKNANGIDKDERNGTVIDEELGHSEKSIHHVDPIEARTSRNFKRAIFAVVVLMVLCVVSTLVVLRVVGNNKNSQKGTNLDENENNGGVYGVAESIAQDSVYIPPPPTGLGWEETTRSTAVPENNLALDDETETGNDNGHDVVELIAPSGNVSTLESTIENEIDNGDR